MKIRQYHASSEESQASGVGHRRWVVAAEELAWGDSSAVLNIPGPGLGGPPVRMMGSPEQKERFLSVFQDEMSLRYGACAMTEPGAGTDLSRIATLARKQGSDYILDGAKCFITNGAKADWVVVFATVDPSAGRAGQRAFVVERGTPGFRVGKIEQKMGMHASETAELLFESCRVSERNLLGGEAFYTGSKQGGFVGAMATFDATRPAIGAMAVGIARASFEIARDFLMEKSSPLTPSLARMLREIESARLLCWRAAWMADMKMPNTREASMAKAYSAEVAMRVCAESIQLIGAEASTRSLLLEKLFRDIKVFDIFEGTAQAQRMVVAKRL